MIDCAHSVSSNVTAWILATAASQQSNQVPSESCEASFCLPWLRLCCHPARRLDPAGAVCKLHGPIEPERQAVQLLTAHHLI